MPSPPRSLVQFVLQHVQVKKNLCTRQKVGTGYTLAPRVVPDYNIIFMTAGEVVWVIEGVDHVLGPGRMVLVPPAVPHQGYSRTDEMCLLSYHADVTLPGGQNVFDLLIPPRSQTVVPGSRLDHYLRQAGDEHDRPDPMDANLMLRSWVELIFTELLRDNFERGLLDYRETDPVVVDVLESLLDRVSEPTTLEELAQFAGYSPQHLNRVFRRALGVTPLQYLTRLRMQRASELLTEGRLTVRAIARAVSFDDPYYFSRLFKQHTGESPAQYRERTGSESPSLHSDAPFPPPPGSG
jgi:AraC-like DNA-binding protein